jgi:Malectin domain
MYVFIYTDAESGRRVFNALVNGRTLAPDLDIFQVVGTRTAYTVEATIQVNDAFEIALEFDNLIDNPKISGFEIYDVTGSFVPSTLINSGGPEYIDAQQRVWMADAYFAGGTAVTTVTTFGIAGTDDDCTTVNGMASFRMSFPSRVATHTMSRCTLPNWYGVRLVNARLTCSCKARCALPTWTLLPWPDLI